jgi:hypothetical protein
MLMCPPHHAPRRPRQHETVFNPGTWITIWAEEALSFFHSSIVISERTIDLGSKRPIAIEATSLGVAGLRQIGATAATSATGTAASAAAATAASAQAA